MRGNAAEDLTLATQSGLGVPAESIYSARITVCRYANDSEEALLFLQMLGLAPES